MEPIKIIRDQVSSVVDIDFFLNEANLNAKYEDGQIAQIIEGQTYERTKQRIDEFIGRCKATLADLQSRVEQTELEWRTLVEKANANHPGKPPSDFWVRVRRDDPNVVARYNEAVEEYNNKLELYRRICDQANHAKDRYEDALEKFNERKAELEEQVRQRIEELKPALDQDIIRLLSKMQQLVYDNIENKNNPFAGFLLIYLTKKVYNFLYDRIYSATEQRTAIEISEKLEDELNNVILNREQEIREGLKQSAQYLATCLQENDSLLKVIEENLQRLPYQQCNDNEVEIQNLLSLPIETSFQYKNIIDPVELEKIEEQVQARKSSLEKQLTTIDTFISNINPIFDSISDIKTFVEDQLARMNQNKNNLDPILKDLKFILEVFDEANQDRYLGKYIPWIKELHEEIQQIINIDVIELLKKVIDTQLLTKPALELLNANPAFLFLTNKKKLAQKKQEFINGIQALSSILKDINELPKEKAEECQNKVSSWLNISLLPLGNVIVLYSLIATIKQFLPALTSHNLSYVQLKQTLIKKFQIFFYLHVSLTVISGVASFLVRPLIQVILYFITFTYLISSMVIYIKGRQLRRL